MKTIKKATFGALLALLTFGFSAFTTISRSNEFTYYKTNTSFSATNPNGYQYFSGDRCETGGTICSAKWDIGSQNAPTEGDPLPLTGVTLKTTSITAGHFE
jgi:hypothetical protein